MQQLVYHQYAIPQAETKIDIVVYGSLSKYEDSMSAKEKPEVGERYTCEGCGMQIEVTAPCKCKGEDGPEFRCCGADMRKAEQK